MAHPSGRIVLAVGPVSAVVERRLVVVSGVLAVCASLLLLINLALGDFPVPLADVLPAAVGRGGADADFVVRTLRLPRALTGALVGAAFGLSGAVFQSVTRNVLASPDIIGITAGASAGAVALIAITGGSAASVTGGALGGALVAMAAIHLLAWRDGITGTRLVLVGVGVSAALYSVVSYLLIRADIEDAARATAWLTGSLHARGWDHVAPVALALALLVPPLLSRGRGVRALQLGDDAARGLGVRVGRTRGIALGCAVLLAAVATASAGPIAFVALAAPPIARRLSATGGVALVPAALVGSCTVLAADLVAQHLMGGLPVGVATALLGGPHLLLLLHRSNRIGSDG